MSNIALVQAILRSCWQAGVREIILCSGARNAPFVKQLSLGSSFKVHSFFEERSAGFFALGRMLTTRSPVAVLTTSGTAAAELLPAAVESDYQGLPLVMITADRPSRYRGSGAPQTINQIGLYSHYIEKSFDIEGSWSETLRWSGKRPIHLNVCFDEPLIDTKPQRLDLQEEGAVEPALADFTDQENVELTSRKPLVVLGGLAESWQANVLETLVQWRRPVFAEGLSGLRGHPELKDLEVQGGEASLAQLNYDSVIRIGRIPTLRLWRELENSEIPVFHFSDLSFSGLPRQPVVFPLNCLATVRASFVKWEARELLRDRDLAAHHLQLFAKYPLSEPAWIQWLSSLVPLEARLFLGNSLPIREWDQAAHWRPRKRIYANRGTNGIDGLISTFLGTCAADIPNWAIVGDLSALYDLSALWAAKDLDIKDINLVVINNGGGKIFHRLFSDALFENRHQLNLSHWAAMWSWNYQALRERKNAEPTSTGPRLLEIFPDHVQTDQFWDAWSKI